MKKRPIKLIAHGGFPAKYRENSLAGFLAAAKFKPFAIEIDLVFDPSSNELVCFHPEGVSSSQGTYDSQVVNQQLVSDNKKISLDQVLKRLPDSRLLLDLKQPNQETFNILASLETNTLNRLLVGVRDLNDFKFLLGLNSSIKTLALFTYPDEYLGYANLGGEYFRLWQKDINQARLDQIHQAGLKVWVTPGHKATETQPRTAGEIDQKTFERFVEMGVDGVLVNDIERVSEYLEY